MSPTRSTATCRITTPCRAPTWPRRRGATPSARRGVKASPKSHGASERAQGHAAAEDDDPGRGDGTPAAQSARRGGRSRTRSPGPPAPRRARPRASSGSRSPRMPEREARRRSRGPPSPRGRARPAGPRCVRPPRARRDSAPRWPARLPRRMRSTRTCAGIRHADQRLVVVRADRIARSDALNTRLGPGASDERVDHRRIARERPWMERSVTECHLRLRCAVDPPRPRARPAGPPRASLARDGHRRVSSALSREGCSIERVSLSRWTAPTRARCDVTPVPT